jgi:hypothetical protein
MKYEREADILALRGKNWRERFALRWQALRRDPGLALVSVSATIVAYLLTVAAGLAVFFALVDHRDSRWFWIVLVAVVCAVEIATVIYLNGIWVTPRLRGALDSDPASGSPLAPVKISGPIAAIVLLVIALFTSLGILGYTMWQNYMWKMEVDGLAGYMGSTRAMHDFRAGKIRLFVIAGERDEDKYSGTNDGPFEVWYPQYYPQYEPVRSPTERMVEFYNRKMRHMREHPAKFAEPVNAQAPNKTR